MIIEFEVQEKGFQLVPENKKESIFLFVEKKIISEALKNYHGKKMNDDLSLLIMGIIEGLCEPWEIPEKYKNITEDEFSHIKDIDSLLFNCRVEGESFFNKTNELISESTDISPEILTDLFQANFSSNYCQNMVALFKKIFEIGYVKRDSKEQK